MSSARPLKRTSGTSSNQATATHGRELLEEICRCPSLPSLPGVVVEVMQAASRKDADVRSVASLIAKDPALVGRVLQTVNSSFYGMSHRISSVQHAVPILGLTNLRILLAGHAVLPAIKRFRGSGQSAHDTMEACRRSLYSGAAAQALAKRIPGADPEASFLAALLMDVGAMAMGQVIGEKYGAVVRAAEHHSDLPRLETERFGFSHALVGTLLTRQWKIPDNLAGAIQFHHDPACAPIENGTRDMAKLIRLAGLCADVFIEHNPLWPISEASRISAADFSLNKGTLGEVLEELARETRRLGAAFEVRIDPAATFARAQEIAAKQVQQCFEGIGEAPPAEPMRIAPNVVNQRREPRHRRSGSVTMFACSETTVGREMKASLRDISTTGVGLTLGVPLAPGFQFVVALQRGGQRLTAIQYEVRHCRANDMEDQFAIGAELTRVLRESDLMAESSEDSPLHRIGRKLLGRGG